MFEDATLSLSLTFLKICTPNIVTTVLHPMYDMQRCAVMHKLKETDTSQIATIFITTSLTSHFRQKHTFQGRKQ